MARAFGSYPKGHWFKSNYRYQIWPVGQVVKTRPFHGCNMGSSPVRVTNGGLAQLARALASHARGREFESPSLHQNIDCESSRYFFAFSENQWIDRFVSSNYNADKHDLMLK